jgi:hypothetical protein
MRRPPKKALLPIEPTTDSGGLIEQSQNGTMGDRRTPPAGLPAVSNCELTTRSLFRRLIR